MEVKRPRPTTRHDSGATHFPSPAAAFPTLIWSLCHLPIPSLQKLQRRSMKFHGKVRMIGHWDAFGAQCACILRTRSMRTKTSQERRIFHAVPCASRKLAAERTPRGAGLTRALNHPYRKGYVREISMYLLSMHDIRRGQLPSLKPHVQSLRRPHNSTEISTSTVTLKRRMRAQCNRGASGARPRAYQDNGHEPA